MSIAVKLSAQFVAVMTSVKIVLTGILAHLLFVRTAKKLIVSSIMLIKHCHGLVTDRIVRPAFPVREESCIHCV